MYKYLIILLILVNSAFGQKENKVKDAALSVYSKRSVPFLSMQQLRNGGGDTAQIIFVNEGLRSGIFQYNKFNRTSLDDSSLVLRFGNRRYERMFTHITPEYFGANPNDTIDDGPSIQKALNSASEKGIKIILSEGTYLTSIPLKPKIVVPSPVYGYRLTLEGAGSGLTRIKSTHNRDIINITEGSAIFNERKSDIIIKDIHFDANNIAAHCINIANIAGFKLLDCKMTGAVLASLKIGSEKSENFGIDIVRCYSSGKTINEGHNNAGIELINARYVYIDRFTTDGSKYGIYMEGDKSYITNCHLEGNKVASIYIKGTGGGEHKISNNMLLPYVDFEPAAKFDGKIEGIHIEGTAGGSACNLVYGNVLLVPNPSTLPLKFKISKANNLLRAHPGFIITGASSGAQGKLFGYERNSGKALIQVTKGNFTIGETIKQSITGGIALVDSIIVPVSYGISLNGTSWNNVISENQIRMNPTVGIYITGNDNIISNNNIEAVTSIYKDASFAIIMGNILQSERNTALNNVSGKIEAVGNKYLGTVTGVSNLLQQPASSEIDEIKSQDSNITVNTKGQIIISKLPTSPTNLPSGAIWMDTSEKNILKRVP